MSKRIVDLGTPELKKLLGVAAKKIDPDCILQDGLILLIGTLIEQAFDEGWESSEDNAIAQRRYRG